MAMPSIEIKRSGFRREQEHEDLIAKFTCRQ